MTRKPKPRRPGGQPKPPAQVRRIGLTLRLTPVELSTLRTAARNRDATVADYVREHLGLPTRAEHEEVAT